MAEGEAESEAAEKLLRVAPEMQQLIEDLLAGREVRRDGAGWRRPRGRPAGKSDEPEWISWTVDKIRRHGDLDGQLSLSKTEAVRQYAQQVGVSRRYVWRVLRMARLAEEAAEAADLAAWQAGEDEGGDGQDW